VTCDWAYPTLTFGDFSQRSDIGVLCIHRLYLQLQLK
jgi:hypothetical protein